MSNEAEQFLSTGGKSFPFEQLGDQVQGDIVDVNVVDQRNMESGVVMTWDDGSPRKQMVITLQTDLRDDADDDGIRNVYIKGGNYTADQGSGSSSKTALQQACKKAGVKSPDTGGRLRMAYTGIGVKTNRGFAAPKLYTIAYEKGKDPAPDAFLFPDD